MKERIGGISRIAPDGCSAVCKGLFKRESDISFFEGAHVITGRGEPGVIQVRLCACQNVAVCWAFHMDTVCMYRLDASESTTRVLAAAVMITWLKHNSVPAYAARLCCYMATVYSSWYDTTTE
jgi:hypothetical protein